MTWFTSLSPDHLIDLGFGVIGLAAFLATLPTLIDLWRQPDQED
jgi:hypothetical protein